MPALFRDGGGLSMLRLLLGGDPGEVVSAMGSLDVLDAHAAGVIGGGDAAAGRAGRCGRGRRGADQAQQRADERRRVAGLQAEAARSPTSWPALRDVDKQLAQLQTSRSR